MSELKRFVLFRGDEFYPGGGWDDYEGTFDSVAQAKRAHESSDCKWAQVVDLEAGTVVAHVYGLRPWKDGPLDW